MDEMKIQAPIPIGSGKIKRVSQENLKISTSLNAASSQVVTQRTQACM